MRSVASSGCVCDSCKAYAARYKIDRINNGESVNGVLDKYDIYSLPFNQVTDLVIKSTSCSFNNTGQEFQISPDFTNVVAFALTLSGWNDDIIERILNTPVKNDGKFIFYAPLSRESVATK